LTRPLPAPAPLPQAPRLSAASPPAAAAAHTLPLALRDVHKRWEKDQEPVLEGVDLDLDLGTKTWIGGRNGAGKTTLLRIAAGLIEPDRGRAQAWGFSPRERRGRYHRLVAFLPAGDRGLYARLTVRRQLSFWAAMAMLEPKGSAARVEEMIERFDLGELAERRVDRLSMGQRQRVRIAMALLPEPETLLLDEPLTSLDSEGTALLSEAIESLLGRGGALLWCSPSGDHPDLNFDADLILERGRLVEA
jgi:ABC-2 type transport system ATP-binding protein